MTSRREPSRDELQAMKRVDLQRMAKDFHIKANLKTDALINEIMRARASQSTSLAPTASPPRRGQPDIDEQENLPKPKLAIDSPGRVRKPKLVVGKLKPAGSEGIRKTSGVKSLIIPPGVVAANGDKGKGRQKKTNHTRGGNETTLVLSQTASLEDVREDGFDSDAVMKTPRNATTSLPIIASSSGKGSYSDAALVSILDMRVERLESENEMTENELTALRRELKEAQNNIAELTRQNEQLRSQIDGVKSVSQDNISEIFERLLSLEDTFKQVSARPRAVSISSSEADLATPPVRKMEVRTPPGQIGMIGRGSLAPAFSYQGSRRDRNARHTPLRVPTDPRRYTNPDESPSPTRPTHPTIELSIGGQPGTYSRNSTYAPPNLESHTLTAMKHARRDSATSQRSRMSLKMEDVAIRLDDKPDGEESDAYDRRATSPDMPSTKFQLVPSSSRSSNAGSTRARALPHPITIASSPHSSEPAEKTPLANRRRRSTKGSRKLHPYARRIPHSNDGYESPDPISAPHSPSNNMRDIFGTTPDPSRIPPLPLVNGRIPVLHIGGGRRSHSESYVARETPQSSPMRSHPVNPPETPPASRTRYGTEIGSAMRARFSDNEGSAPWKSQ